MATGEGYVWTPNTADGTVSKVDPASNRVVATIRVGSRSSLLKAGCGPSDVHQAPYGSAALRACDLPSGLAVGEGSVWVTANDINAMLRIDPRSNRVTATIPLGSRPFDVGTGSGMVWVSDFYADGLWRIDPVSNRVVAHITGVAHGPSTVRVSADAVWVANARDGLVSRVDPSTNAVVATIATGRRPLAMALDTHLWVRDDFDLTLTKIDPRNNSIVAVIPVGPRDPTIDYVDSIAVGGGSVWVSGMKLQRVDEGTNRVVQEFPQDADTVALGFGSVWVSDIFGVLKRLRPDP
jgi:virginiamycin B lyase